MLVNIFAMKDWMVTDKSRTCSRYSDVTQTDRDGQNDGHYRGGIRV